MQLTGKKLHVFIFKCFSQDITSPFRFFKDFFFLLLSEGHSQREAGRGSTSAGLLQNGHDDRSWAGVKSEAHSNERVEIPAEC